METNYSADDITAAMSLQFFQVRFFFVDTRRVILSNLYVHQYIYSASCLNSIFIVLTQPSFDNYILGEFVPMSSLLPLNSPIQTYNYACSLHEEVTYLLRDTPRIWCWLYSKWRFLLVSHWTKAKGLYIATRYVPFLLLATNLYCTFSFIVHRPIIN